MTWTKLSAPTAISAELDQVRATPPQQIAAEFAWWQARSPAAPGILRDHPELAGDPAQVRDLLASMLHRAWQALIEPWWPRLRDVLYADITVRAGQLAQAGLAATLNDLDPKVSYRDGVLRCAMTATQELDAAGAQLVLIPSVFAWPGVGVNFDPPAVIYPARGTAALWQPPGRTPSDLAHSSAPPAPGCWAPSASPLPPAAWPPAAACPSAPPASTSASCAPTASSPPPGRDATSATSARFWAQPSHPPFRQAFRRHTRSSERGW